jgi:ribosomal protein L2
MTKKHMKKCSTSLAIKKIKSRTYQDSILLPLEVLPSRTQITNVGEDVGEKGNLIHC